jgi:hypothetical protein
MPSVSSQRDHVVDGVGRNPTQTFFTTDFED